MYVVALDVELELELGVRVRTDAAFGGNYHTIAESDELKVDVTGRGNSHATKIAMQILEAVNKELGRVESSPPVVDHVLFHAEGGTGPMQD